MTRKSNVDAVDVAAAADVAAGADVAAVVVVPTVNCNAFPPLCSAAHTDPSCAHPRQPWHRHLL